MHPLLVGTKNSKYSTFPSLPFPTLDLKARFIMHMIFRKMNKRKKMLNVFLACFYHLNRVDQSI